MYRRRVALPPKKRRQVGGCIYRLLPKQYRQIPKTEKRQNNYRGVALPPEKCRHIICNDYRLNRYRLNRYRRKHNNNNNNNNDNDNANDKWN